MGEESNGRANQRNNDFKVDHGISGGATHTRCRQNTGAVVSEYKGKQRFMRFGTPGMADLLAFVNSPFAGLIVHWLEVKTATGKQSELQKSFQNQVEAAGHRYSVVRSIEDVETALK